MAVIRLSDPELHGVLSPSPPLVFAAAAAFVLGVAQGAGAATIVLLAVALGLAAAAGLATATRAGAPGRRRPAAPLGWRGDLYAILGVSSEARPGEIEQAFREIERALQARAPEYLGGRADDMMLPEMIGLRLAFETLSDPVRRAAYDRRRTAGRHPSLSVQKSAE